MISLILSAVVPVFVIILYIYIKDKYEKEPKRLLLGHFVLGAVVSIIITTILYILIGELIEFDKNSIIEQFAEAFFVVAVFEEFSKYVIVRYVAQRNSHFNEPFDGIVYAVMVSMGFAATENIMYVLNGGYGVALTRAFTAVPAHATFAILMGYYMGKAKFSSKHRIRYNLAGLLLAILFHGAYDFFLFIDFVPGIWMGAFVSLIIAIVLSHKAIKKHQKISYFKPK